MSNRPEQLRAQILALVEEYYQAAFAGKAFVPGETPVPVSGRVFDGAELQHLVDAGRRGVDREPLARSQGPRIEVSPRR